MGCCVGWGAMQMRADACVAMPVVVVDEEPDAAMKCSVQCRDVIRGFAMSNLYL